MAQGRYKVLTPDEFLALWDEYKAHVDENPDKIDKATNSGVHTELVKRPYLRAGFEAYVYRKLKLHIHQYIDNYKNAYEEFLGVVTCARKEWENDQISGTLTGRYKAPNLTARLNGLIDRKELDHTTKGEPITGMQIVDSKK